MTSVGPIFVLDEIAQLDQALISLLKSLQASDWERQTIAPLWKVKDIVAHLLDGSIRGVSTSRDQYFGDPPSDIQSYQDLLDYLNRLNADWVKAMKRVSPAMMIALLENANRAYQQHLATLDPFGEAIFGVGWAGEDKSAAWFHIAREYTEKWHHQQQIRLAVGKDEVLLEDHFYIPLLDTFMRALPHHYREVEASESTALQFEVSGVSKCWYLIRDNGQWILSHSGEPPLHSRVTIDRSVAWRIFTKGISRKEAQKHIQLKGDLALGQKILDMVAIMG